MLDAVKDNGIIGFFFSCSADEGNTLLLELLQDLAAVFIVAKMTEVCRPEAKAGKAYRSVCSAAASEKLKIVNQYLCAGRVADKRF